MNDIAKVAIILFLSVMVADAILLAVAPAFAVTVPTAPTIPEFGSPNLSYGAGNMTIYNISYLAQNARWYPVVPDATVLNSVGTIWYALTSNSTAYEIKADSYQSLGNNTYTFIWSASTTATQNDVWGQIGNILSYAGGLIFYFGSFIVYVVAINGVFITILTGLNSTIATIVAGVIAIVVIMAMLEFIRGTKSGGK